ncbi:MAG: hypothetical protein P8X57_08785, partial [Cyclobacteriaceae bacterium]
MRIFEIILLFTVTGLPFIKRSFLKRIRPNHLVLVLAAILIIHLVFEGYRWQMIPAYLLLIILAWRIKTIDISQPVRLSFLRIIGYGGILILVVLGWILPMSLPVFDLPQPRGKYFVGSRSIHIQTGNDEIITKDPNDKRELMIKIWYPSEADVSSM